MIQPALASSALESLQARAKEKHLASHPYWYRLLHYRRNLLGRYQSEINDRSFFFSPAGRSHPSDELNATLAAFFASPQPSPDGRGRSEAAGEAESQHPQCQYPERYAWLKEQLNFDESTLPAGRQLCPRFEAWRDQMNAQSVTLIFASAYMNNPSSMYGHTFLRLNRRAANSREHLLDYAVNFAADLANDNGVLFALKGLMGSYPGRFSTMPYYMKVQEYNNLESRDLWEFELNLSSGAIDRLLGHLWELGMAGQPYYFLNKNCSYYLLPLLEVVEPSLRLKDPFVFRTAPVDTLRKVMSQPGLVGPVVRRLSLTSKLLEERIRLTEPEIRLAENLSLTALKELPPERQALVLDTAYDLFRRKVGFKRDQPKEVQEKERQLLLLRNQVEPAKLSFPSVSGGESMDPRPAPAEDDGKRTPPINGHPTGRIGLSYGFSNRSHFEELSLRPAIHDQDDPPEGFLPGSKLEMFHAKLRYDNDRNTLYLQQFDIINLLSITPWDRWIHPPSWKVNSGFGVAQDLNRDPENSLYYGLNLGSGYAARANDQTLLFAMAEMDMGLGHPFNHFVRFGGGPSGGVLFNPVNLYRARFQASSDAYAVGSPSATKLGVYQSFSLTKDFELRAKLERQNTYKEVLFSLVWFL